MNNHATLEKMQQMKFYGMVQAFKACLDSKLASQMHADELLAHLIEQEWLDREERKTQRHIRSARFRYQATIEEIDYASQRNLDKNQLIRLVDCSFIDRKENLLLTGPTGVGHRGAAKVISHLPLVIRLAGWDIK